jgi:hypothetical protein
MKIPRARFGVGEIVAVLALFALGTALRFWRLDLGWFGVDQARDIQTAFDVAAGRDWPTVGPTMRRVTSLGALYYYVWSVPALLSDDPLAAYRFAAALGVTTLVGVWALARRWWGMRAALLALAVIATSGVAIIDARIAWAPAALPAMAVLLLWLLTGASTPGRLAALGAALGVAVQLHLAMAAWVVAAALLVSARRPTGRALGIGVIAALVTGFPAAYAALANAGADAGIATLPGRGPLPNVLGRLSAVAMLGARIPPAFWQWPDAPEPGARAAWIAALLVAAIVLLGVGRLLAVRDRRWPETVLLTVAACQVGMVVLLPGEAWYYYLDALLPVGALIAGVLAAPRGEATAQPATALTLIVVTASLVLALQSARWLAASAHHGYVALQPAPLALDGAGGRDAAVPGRLLAVGVKRDVATLLAAEPADFATRWRTVHGPAFDDATGDNGFWLARATAAPARALTALRHAVLWYRDDPGAPTGAPPGVELTDVGPLRIARYAPAILYDACRDAQGPVAVPIRVVPAPRRYGDGTIARSATLPTHVDCAVAPGAGGVRVVVAVGAGTVSLADAGGVRSPAGATTDLCIPRGNQPAAFGIDVVLPPNTPSDLDLYERPDAECGAAKIAR